MLSRICLLLLSVFPLLAQNDVKGSSDHPLFPNRMPNYYISSYQTQGFASYNFQTRPAATPIEGKYTKMSYYLNDPSKHPGGLAVRRNYENAIKAVGGQVVFSSDILSVLKVNRNGVETWAEVQAGTNRYIYLNIVERVAMTQVIQADAMASALNRDGFIALDINFATGSAEILADSQPQIDQMVAMLKANPALRVGVDGHTDNTGTPAGNKTLSQNRANSVMAALVKGGIAANRMTATGYGQEQPIADNRTEDGRFKNRRVELTKK